VAARADQRVCVGRIGAPHGVRGEVRLQSFTGDPMAIADYGPLESKDGKLTVEIETLRPAKNVLVARLKRVTDRDAAEKLRNIELYVARDRLPAPETDEFYHADLIGLAVRDETGAEIGTISAIHDFGAGDILEVTRKGALSVMVPFTRAAVPEVAPTKGFVRVDSVAAGLAESPDEGNAPAA